MQLRLVRRVALSGVVFLKNVERGGSKLQSPPIPGKERARRPASHRGVTDGYRELVAFTLNRNRAPVPEGPYKHETRVFLNPIWRW